MKKYRVLWFDDEFESLDIIKEKGKLDGIILHGYNNAKDGIEELKRHVEDYDAVVVDGKFYNDPGQSGDALNDQALFNVGVAIESLSDRKRIPWFILSGQISFTKEKNRYAEGFKSNKVYDKTIDLDIRALWNDIKSEADKQIDTQIRHNYERVFDVCTDKYLGEEAGRKIFDAIKIVENDSATKNTEDFFNSVRKVIEKLFVGFNKIGILPDEILKQPGWLNNSCKFLCGTHPGYKLNEEIFHPTISFTIKHIMLTIQDASHNEGNLSLKIDEHVRTVSTPYLYKSIVLQLLDILIWYKDYADIHSNVEANKFIYSNILLDKSTEYIGEIEQDNLGNYYCGDYLLNYNYVKANFRIGDLIQIIESTDNAQKKVSHLYPKFAIKFNKVL